MPKKKGSKKIVNTDFTINDSANASKPVRRVKKSVPETVTQELSWDEVQDNDFDLVEETDADGTKTFVYKKKKKHSKCETDNIDERPGIVYPEIVWYLISQYIKPEEIGQFAGICRATHAITKRESFWRTLYKRYCQNHPKLPEKLRIENNYKLYGLRQRVIRALHHTYDVFIKKITQQALHDSRPHLLVKRRCVNLWYYKGPSYWVIYFKFKKLNTLQRMENGVNFIEELGRIDANPDEDSQVLQVTCQSFYEVPPLMGMTLSSVSVVLSQGFRHHRLQLGFNTGHHNVSRNILPECSVILDTVVNMLVFDWWHPKYPHFENSLPSCGRDEEATPVLKKDFFQIRDGDFEVILAYDWLGHVGLTLDTGRSGPYVIHHNGLTSGGELLCVKIFKIFVFFACAVAICNADAPVTPPVRCGTIPSNLYACIGHPQVVRSEISAQCTGKTSECARIRCIFEKSGWMNGEKVDKAKVTAYFDQYAKDHAEWSPAVQQVKTSCLSADLPAQGATLNCPAFDVIMCALTKFVKNAQPSQWAGTPQCLPARQFAAACPLCPEDCFAPLIPTGSCQACVLLPRTP